MKQQPDKFFRDKLNDHQVNMSSDAWSKIETGLSPRRSFKTRLSVAASALILMLSGYFIFHTSSNNISSTPPVSNSEKSYSDPINPDTKNNTQHTQSPTKDYATIPAHTLPEQAIIRSKSPLNKKDITPVSESPAIEPTPAVAENSTRIISPTIIQSDAEYSSEVSSTVTPSTPSQRSAVRLVFSSKEVNNKYLKYPGPPDTSLVQNKKSTISKILLAASNLKHNEYSLGDLREIKDQLLTFNFLEEKKNNN